MMIECIICKIKYVKAMMDNNTCAFCMDGITGEKLK